MLATSPLCHLLDQRAYRPVPCAFQSTCADMVGCTRLSCIRNFVHAIPQSYCLSSRKSPVCLPANFLFVIQVSVRNHRGRSLHANCRRRGLPRAMSSSSDAFTGLLPIYATLLGHRGTWLRSAHTWSLIPGLLRGKFRVASSSESSLMRGACSRRVDGQPQRSQPLRHIMGVQRNADPMGLMPALHHI